MGPGVPNKSRKNVGSSELDGHKNAGLSSAAQSQLWPKVTNKYGFTVFDPTRASEAGILWTLS